MIIPALLLKILAPLLTKTMFPIGTGAELAPATIWIVRLPEFALKTAVSADVGEVTAGFQLPAYWEAVPHERALGLEAVPVHVRFAAEVSELMQATVPIAIKANAIERAKEKLDLMQNPFFG